MSTEMKALRELFFLVDNPFSPTEDTERKFRFGTRGAYLNRALNVFEIKELLEYFVKVGYFKSAVDDLTEYLDNTDYPKGGAYPPAFYIYGASGAGRSTMAYYIAHRIKELSKQAEAALGEIPVKGSDLAKHLFSIKGFIKRHAAKHEVQACLDIIQEYDAQMTAAEPNERLLKEMFSMLRQSMIDLPPLILIMENLEYIHHDRWFGELYTILKDLNVVLIFIGDNALTDRFERLLRDEVISGLVVSLSSMDREMGTSFLQSRVDTFRLSTFPAGANRLFPFFEPELAVAFKDPPVLNLRYMLNLLNTALKLKLRKLAPFYTGQEGPGAAPQFSEDELRITAELIEDSIKTLMKK
jgi:hypothetical protein